MNQWRKQDPIPKSTTTTQERRQPLTLEKGEPAGTTLFSIDAYIPEGSWSRTIGWYDVKKAPEFAEQLPPETAKQDIVRGNIYVQEEYRRRGVASNILEQLFTEYRALGVTAVIGLEPDGQKLRRRFDEEGFTPFTPQKPERLEKRYLQVQEWLYKEY